MPTHYLEQLKRMESGEMDPHEPLSITLTRYEWANLLRAVHAPDKPTPQIGRLAWGSLSEIEFSVVTREPDQSEMRLAVVVDATRDLTLNAVVHLIEAEPEYPNPIPFGRRLWTLLLAVWNPRRLYVDMARVHKRVLVKRIKQLQEALSND